MSDFRLKCTEFDFSAPNPAGELTTLHRLPVAVLVYLRGLLLWRNRRRGGGERRGERRKGKRGTEGSGETGEAREKCKAQARSER